MKQNLVVSSSPSTTWNAKLCVGVFRMSAFALIAFGMMSPLPCFAEYTLIPYGATWEFFDDLTTSSPYPNNPTRWREAYYETSHTPFGEWETGVAPFAHGDIDAFSGPVTPIDAPAANELTVLFRHEFMFPENITFDGRATWSFLCDDGCIIWLNGFFYGGLNMRFDGITHTPASTAFSVGNESGFTVQHSELRLDAFLPGRNVLAVEVHNASATSSDLGFELSLTIPVPEPSGGEMAAIAFVSLACGSVALRRARQTQRLAITS